jgi:cholesterol transport system auxiliary component
LSVAAAVLALSLAGCAGMGDLIGKGSATAYDLAPAKDFAHGSGRARGQLVIVEPTALAPLDGTAILVRPVPGEAAQLAGAQWEDRLPRLMQARLLQSFENANRLRAVGSPSDKIVADFVLLSELRAFEISATDGSAVVEIAVKIVNQRSGRIMAARVFRVTVPAAATQGPGAVAALNEAFAKVATELVLWAAKVV